MSKNKEKDEEIGYCKPPKSTQFKKGQSGNPKGRPKETFDFDAAYERALQKRVAVHENGRRKKVSKLEAAVTQQANKSAAGDASAVKLLMAWFASRRREARIKQEEGIDYGEVNVITHLYMTPEEIRAKKRELEMEMPEDSD